MEKRNMKDELDVLKFRHIPRCTPIGEVSMEQDESMILQKTDEEDRGCVVLEDYYATSSTHSEALFSTFGIEEADNNQALFLLLQNRNQEDHEQIELDEPCIESGCGAKENILTPDLTQTQPPEALKEITADKQVIQSEHRIRIKSKFAGRGKTIEKPSKAENRISLLKDIYCPISENSTTIDKNSTERNEKIGSLKNYLRDKIQRNNNNPISKISERVNLTTLVFPLSFSKTYENRNNSNTKTKQELNIDKESLTKRSKQLIEAYQVKIK